MSRTRLMSVLLGALLCAAPTVDAAFAQDYPTKPVRLLVGYAAGGGSDGLTRPFAEKLSEMFGQQFVIEHRGGAAAAIATEAVAKSSPDGHTLAVIASGPLTILPHLRKLPYAPDDLVPVARMGEINSGMAVHPSLGVATLKDFVALAKTRPGHISYSSGGVATLTHFRGLMLNQLAGIEMLHVPYKGNGEALADLLAGNVQVMFEVVVLPHAKAGKLNLLATLGDTRNPDFPDTPTMKEAGYPDYELPIWFGFFAPKGTPDAIVRKLNAAVDTISRRPDIIARMREGSYTLNNVPPEELRKIIAAESVRFAKLIKDANIKLE